MSLKHFHIAFISICTLTAWGFGAWTFLTMGLPDSFRILGGLSVLGGIALLIYGVKFYHKAKNIIT